MSYRKDQTQKYKVNPNLKTKEEVGKLVQFWGYLKGWFKKGENG